MAGIFFENMGGLNFEIKEKDNEDPDLKKEKSVGNNSGDDLGLLVNENIQRNPGYRYHR